MPQEVVNIALAGLGGFGHIYVNGLLAETTRPVKFVAGIDPAPERCNRLADLQAKGIPIYSSLDAFFAKGKCDLIILSSPLQLHCEQVCQALAHGCHVLCEKPLGASPEQAKQMIQARDKSGKQVAIGYQWSYAPAITRLKQDILAGRLGRPLRMRCIVLWPRDHKYFTRSSWAGKQRDEHGRLVLDSPVNNACAHYLHNMFYILGEAPDKSAFPKIVQAELYRANAIENYDTGVIRASTSSGVEIMFVTSHAIARAHEPAFVYEFENATACYGDSWGNELTVKYNNGMVEKYGPLPEGVSLDKLWAMVDSIGRGEPVACGPEAASAQTRCMYAAQQSMPQIRPFPPSLTRCTPLNDSQLTWVEGLDRILENCYTQYRLPSELGISWAHAGERINL